MSVGSHKLKRTSITSRPCSSPICLTISDLPIPGGPHMNTGRLILTHLRRLRLASLGVTVRFEEICSAILNFQCLDLVKY